MHIIETQHKKIPWRWVVLTVLISLPPAIGYFAQGSLTFSLRKFIDSPAIINLVSSLDFFFKIVITATCLYYSDRIWTRFGRRSPFIIVAWLGMVVCLFLLPLSASAMMIIPLVILLLVFNDVGQTFQSLQMEIVPPNQRGRFSAMWQFVQQLMILFYGVMLGGRFDERIHRPTFSISGEQTIYWTAALILLLGAIFLWLFFRERKPNEPPPTDHGGGIKGAFLNLFAEKTLWPVYLLAFSQTLVTTGLGAIDPLLMTEQWGYTKQDMGTNVFVGGLINLGLLPIIGYFADRMDRAKMFAIGIGGVLVLQIFYYVFVQFILPEQRPALIHMIVLGEIWSICGLLSNTAFLPLVFDYVPRDKMGTAQAGLNLVTSITRMITLTGVGLWVSYFSRWFMPPGKFDYFSAYLFMILMNIVGCGLFLYFVRQVRRGHIQPLGRTGFKPVEETGAGNPPPTP